MVILALYLLFSLLAAIAYGLDKRAARRGRRRIPERTLHTLELFGGWPGALVARGRLRHKTCKRRYRLVLSGIIALHLAAWIVVLVVIVMRS